MNDYNKSNESYSEKISNLRNSCVTVRVSGIDNSNTNSNLSTSRSRSFSYTSDGKVIFSCSGFIIDLSRGLIITSPTIFLPFIQYDKKKNSNSNGNSESFISINTRLSIEKILKNISIDVILESDIVGIKNNNSNENYNNSRSNGNYFDNSNKIYDPINSWKSCKYVNYISCGQSTLNVLNRLKSHFILSNQGSLFESSFGLVVLELIDKSPLLINNIVNSNIDNINNNNQDTNNQNIVTQVTIGNSLEERSGNRIYVVGSPFGFISPTMFLNSISSGIICNCIIPPPQSTSNVSMFLIDARALPGNEGSAVFNRQGLLIGIVAPPIRSKNDKLPFTLAPVLPIHCFLPKLQELSITPKFSLLSPQIYDSIQTQVNQCQNSIVLVQFKNSWGSGVLIDENGYILTNAHLIIPQLQSNNNDNNNNSNNNSLSLTQQQQQEQAAYPISMYKDILVDIRINKNSIKSNNLQTQLFINQNQQNQQYIWCKGSIEYISHTHLDIALIKIKLNQNNLNNSSNNNGDGLININYNNNSSSINNNQDDNLIKFNHVVCNPLLNPKYGERVFVLGYPLIPPNQNPPISVTRGIISNIVYVDGCAVSYQTTASVHSGNSGGGLFDYKGNFLGIVTCNAKQKNGLIITELNFSIPAVSLINFFQYANGTDKISLDLMRSSKTNKFLRALWKLQITPPPLNQTQTQTQNYNNSNNNSLNQSSNNNQSNIKNNNNYTPTMKSSGKYLEFLDKITPEQFQSQYVQQRNNNNNNNNNNDNLIKSKL